MTRHHLHRLVPTRRAPALALMAVALITGSLGPAVTPATAEPTAVQPEDPANNDGCSTGTGQTAAATLGYANPAFADDFNTFDENKWMSYSGPSEHRNGQFDAEGGGQRLRSQIGTANGVLTIKGEPNGNTGGMSTQQSHRQRYGLWEARVKLPANAVNYHSVLMVLAGPGPEGGGDMAEMDFVEVMEPTGRQVSGFLHLPSGESSGRHTLADNDWHNWAFEWTPQGIRLFVDGRQWHATPPGTTIPDQDGHMTIQLDWFPSDQGRENTTLAELQVDWVRIYEQRAGNTTTDVANTTNGNPPNSTTNSTAANAANRTTNSTASNATSATNASAATSGDGQPCNPCPNGTNSLGQCQQSPNGSQEGCGWYEHPEQSFVDDFAPNAPEGSVLLFYGCVDQTGLVTPASSPPEAGNAVTAVPMRLAREGERPCDDSLSQTQQVSDQQTTTTRANNQQTSTTQANGNQQTNDQQTSGQSCYRRLPSSARFHPTVAIGMLLTNRQVEMNEAPQLLTTPPVGQPSVIYQPTFVCVTNFPSGTNFPGAASVPEDRRLPVNRNPNDPDQGSGDQGNDDQQDPDQDQQDEDQDQQDQQTPDSSSNTTAPQQAAHEEHDAGGGGVQALGAQAGSGRRLGFQGNAAQEGQQDGDQQTSTTQGSDGNQQQDQDQQQDDQGNGNQQQTGNQGNGSFSPGTVGDLAPAQQACLDRQTGGGGAGAQGNGSDQGDNDAQQASQSDDNNDDGNNDDQQDNGQGTGDSSGSGTGTDGQGQGQGSSGGNQPVDGICAQTAQPTGQTGDPSTAQPTGQTGGTGSTGQPGQTGGTGSTGQPGEVDGTGTPGTGTSADPTNPEQTTDPNAQVQPVTDQATGNSVGGCVRVQLYPTIRWDPGDGTGPRECAAPGFVYDGEGWSNQQADQAHQVAGCVYAYDKATGIDDPNTGEARPSEWPGKVSVIWRGDWDNCLVHAGGGSTQFSAGAGHEGNFVDASGMNLDFASMGEGGQAPATGQTGEVANGAAYAGTYNLGLDDDGVQSAVTPLPRAVTEGNSLNTSGDDG